jgi:hypothetical protein
VPGELREDRSEDQGNREGESERRGAGMVPHWSYDRTTES